MNMRDMESKELEQDRPISTGDQHEEEISLGNCVFMLIGSCCILCSPVFVYTFIALSLGDFDLFDLLS